MKQMSHSSLQETELMNIETAHHHEEDKIRVLYEASYKGCVSTLNLLLQEDPGMLHKISSQTVFIETPLHISASHGHHEFTKTLLSRKPELALERNSLRSTPLHLASAEGHTDIVKQLLEARKEACVVRDEEGRIPLHYAVIRGRRDVVLELIRAKPESLRLHDDNGKNIFHLCVMYNHLQILKDLMASDTRDTNKLLIEGDLDGNNTILHLAIMLKQVKTVSYLISIPKIRSEALYLKNDMGYSAPDIVRGIAKDSKSLEIQVILMEFGIKCGRKESTDVASEEDRRGKKKKWLWRYVLETIDQWLVYKGDWLEDMRGNLSMVASVISTMTFQAVLEPPGNVIQQGNDGPLGCLLYKKDEFEGNLSSGPICPGEAVFAYSKADYFSPFIFYNTICFVASLYVALFLISGVPLKHRFVMWMLSVAMGITLTCLLNTYLLGLVLITPYEDYIDQIMYISSLVFIALRLLIVLYLIMIFVIWVVKKLKAKSITKHRKPCDHTANAWI